MLKYDNSALLHFADVIEGHSLKSVRDLPGYNTWGVEIRPEGRTDALLIGENAREFGMDCWPFMAAHEGLHSMATFHFEGSEYLFLLYNICEDWRMNRFLLGVFGDLRQSYEAMRTVILKRWEQNPIVLRSPLSQFLQHLCYTNHMVRKVPMQRVDAGFMEEVMQIRDEFGHTRNWPVTDMTPEAAAYNFKVCQKLIGLIRNHKPPPNLNPGELRQLIQRMGYDVSFRVQRDPKSIGESNLPQKQERKENVVTPDNAPVPVPAARNTNTDQKSPNCLE